MKFPTGGVSPRAPLLLMSKGASRSCRNSQGVFGKRVGKPHMLPGHSAMAWTLSPLGSNQLSEFLRNQLTVGVQDPVIPFRNANKPKVITVFIKMLVTNR